MNCEDPQDLPVVPTSTEGVVPQAFHHRLLNVWWEEKKEEKGKKNVSEAQGKIRQNGSY